MNRRVGGSGKSQQLASRPDALVRVDRLELAEDSGAEAEWNCCKGKVSTGVCGRVISLHSYHLASPASGGLRACWSARTAVGRKSRQNEDQLGPTNTCASVSPPFTVKAPRA